MNKSTALYVMLIGAALSAYDIMTTKEGAAAGDLYGAGKPLESLRVKVYTKPATTVAPVMPAKDYYVSASDAAAVIGAYFYFR
jgi:hypothetical protein